MTEAVKGRGVQPSFSMALSSTLSPIRQAISVVLVLFLAMNTMHCCSYLLDECHDDFDSVIGDKGYKGLGIYTPPKTNAKQQTFWCGFFAKARKSIEAAFSSLARSRNLALQQLNSF